MGPAVLAVADHLLMVLPKLRTSINSSMKRASASSMALLRGLEGGLGRVSTGLPAWISQRSTPRAEASGECGLRAAYPEIWSSILENASGLQGGGE